MKRMMYVFRAKFDSGDIAEKGVLAETRQQAWALIQLLMSSHLGLIIELKIIDEFDPEELAERRR